MRKTKIPIFLLSAYSRILSTQEDVKLNGRTVASVLQTRLVGITLAHGGAVDAGPTYVLPKLPRETASGRTRCMDSAMSGRSMTEGKWWKEWLTMLHVTNWKMIEVDLIMVHVVLQ